MIRAPERAPAERGLRVAVVALGREAGVVEAAEVVAGRLSAREGVGVPIRVGSWEASGPRRDPFEVGRRVGELEVDAAVVVAPTRWGPRRVVPGAVVAGRAVGLVQADAPGELPPAGGGDGGSPGDPGTAPEAPWVVAAMAKDAFLEPTDHWAGTLEAAGRPTVDARADRARRDDLVAMLREGPGVVLYAGHGRTRGWSGYQGLRWRHLRPPAPDRPRPAGVVVAFACDTLKRARSRVDFGTRLVGAGMARAYLGAVGSIRTADAEALSGIVVEHLARREGPATLATLLQGVDRAVAADPAARRAWRSFRLLGDPTAPVERG